MSLFVVIRAFQSGATFASFDHDTFERGVARPLRRLLLSAPEDLRGIVIVTCGQPGSSYAEEVRADGLTPTLAAARKAFPAETASGRVVMTVCYDWGLNPGSTKALNAGIEAGRRFETDHVLSWSPGFALTGSMVSKMVAHASEHGLRLVGYLRSGWWQRVQWMFAQNTCALWDLSLLDAVGGFNPACDGDDGLSLIDTPEFGSVPLAGMEDFEAYLRSYRLQDAFVQWGMAGQRREAEWMPQLTRVGEADLRRNAEKIARQGLVMEAYTRRLFPGVDPKTVIDNVMAACWFA